MEAPVPHVKPLSDTVTKALESRRAAENVERTDLQRLLITDRQHLATQLNENWKSAINEERHEANKATKEAIRSAERTTAPHLQEAVSQVTKAVSVAQEVVREVKAARTTLEFGPTNDAECDAAIKALPQKIT